MLPRLRPRLNHATVVAYLALAVASLAFARSAQAAGDTLSTWGYNASGELGKGDNVDTTSPGPVAGLSGVTAVAGGGFHSIALLSDGTVKTWGSNFEGQLGIGSSSPDSCPGPCSESPITVPGLSHVVAVAAGDDHSLALLSNGTVMAWGQNTHGELGNGNNTGPDTCGSDPCGTSPVPVSGLSHVVAISAGGFHNLALLANGTVMAWGDNENGELGNGNRTGPDTCGTGGCSKKPISVNGVSGVVAISAALVDSQSVALRSNGTLVDWGLNSSGELGNGTNTGPDTCGAPSNACSTKPIAVGGLSGVASIGAASSYTLARLSNGTLRAWGNNYYGNLGDGTRTNHFSPTPVSGISGAAELAVGDGHTLALLRDGTAKAWGRNDNGQLGVGNKTGPDDCNMVACSENPVTVPGLSGITAIAAGFSHTLALVGPSQPIHISLAGRGTGAVGGVDILCPRACSHRYPQSAVVSLLAHAAAGTGFAGYSGACKGTLTCRVTMSKGQNVTATFGRPKETVITSAKVKTKKGTARFSFTAPGAITGFQCAVVKPRHGKHKQKPKPHFSKCRSPKRYKHLKPGRYTFEVRALDILGADPSPARKKFKI